MILLQLLLTDIVVIASCGFAYAITSGTELDPIAEGFACVGGIAVLLLPVLTLALVWT